MHFVKRFRPKYLAGWVHEDICRRLERFLEAVERGEEPRMLLMMPPRSGKSELGSRHFPAWVLGKHPDWEIIAASHTASLTLSFSRYIRDILRDPAYKVLFPNTHLDPASQSTENWNLLNGGGYLAAGVGTGITGRGAHILLLDDLVKDENEATSATITDGTWSWYSSTAYTRLAPGGGVLGIMCMTGDTLVTMANGVRKQIVDIAVGEKVLTWDNGSASTQSVAAVTAQGEDDVFEIRTGNNCVRANARHPLLTPSGWVRVGDLKVGDELVVSGEEMHGDDTYSQAQAWLLGLMFGDGWAKSGTKKSWDKVREKHYISKRAYCGCAVSKDEALTARIVAAFETCFGVTPKRHKGAVALRCDKREVADWFISQGLTGTAHTKRVPEAIFAASFAVREAFLAGFCAADGCERVRAGKLTPRMSVNLCNRALLEDIRQLARSIGFHPTNVHSQERAHQPPGSPVPVKAWMHNVQWQTRRRATDGFHTAKIRTITPAGREEVYDLSVENTHNFIADGIVSHNTWWSEADWAGRIQEVMASGEGDKFEIVRYPAINEEGDEYLLPDDTIVEIIPGDTVPEGAKLTRPKGTAIHPERYSTKAMQRIKSNLFAAGEHWVWNALYQQNPVPDDGTFFTKDMFRFYGSAPARDEMFVYQAWDFAITEGQGKDYTVGACLGQDHRGNLYVLDLVRFQSGDSFVIVDEIMSFARKWKVELLGFEDGQIWKAMSAVFEKACEEARYYPATELLKPLTDKKVRATPLKGLMQHGKVYFDEKADWFQPLRREFTRFLSGGKNDDIVDAVSWAARLTLTRAAPRQKDTQPKTKSWKDKLNQYTGEAGGSHMSA